MTVENNETVIRLAKRDIWEQLSQAQEEAGELIVAINKLRRNKLGSYKSLQEEIADMSIMIAQCKIICGSQQIDAIISEKLARCNERLANGIL